MQPPALQLRLLISAASFCPKRREDAFLSTKSWMETILPWSKKWCPKLDPSYGWRWLTINNLTFTSDGHLSREMSTSSAFPITSVKWSTTSNITTRSQLRMSCSRIWNHTMTKNFQMPSTWYLWLSAWKSRLIDRTKALSSNSSHLKKYSTC